MNEKTIYQVDAFTNTPFKGNPAGVMIVDDKFPAEMMQNLAMEMNLSETAFIIPNENEFRIRYFTPTCEVPLCGQATLASAHIIYELGLKKEDESIAFKAEGADLTISKQGDWIAMNFPAYPLQDMEIHADFKASVGFEPLEMYSSMYDWVIAVADSEAAILSATPDFERMKTNGLGELMITAKGEQPDRDFVLRVFAPSSGISEDPVTGSAHCALTPLWHMKTGKVEFNSLQLSKRTGRLKVKLLGGRVEIKGQAITVFQAHLKIYDSRKSISE
ncbi:MAG: PhzF family phenazine biosynthesis protein [Paludibacter sp.]|nr:PhzF family phenazine biosynthesis protein [Paludibacter sp.]